MTGGGRQHLYLTCNISSRVVCSVCIIAVMLSDTGHLAAAAVIFKDMLRALQNLIRRGRTIELDNACQMREARAERVHVTVYVKMTACVFNLTR